MLTAITVADPHEASAAYREPRDPVTVFPAVEGGRLRPDTEANATRVRNIERGMEDAARQVRFTPAAAEAPTPNASADHPHTDWFDNLVNLLGELVDKIMRYLFDLLTPYVFSLVHNPNVASPYDGTYTVPFALRYSANDETVTSGGVGTLTVPYDFVGPRVKIGVRQGFAVIRAIAVSLLLLLFILTIWKYWKNAAWQNGQSLMGAVGRLIATTALIVFWPVISYHLIQISNEMIDYVFRSIDPVSFVQAMRRLSRIAAQGQLLIILGQVFRVAGPVAGVVVNAATRTVGYFLGFFVFFVAIYQLVHLIILKAIQTGVMLAQFMFAPIFLVFFAAPDTEKVAIGFMRSCVEVSLWTFVWAGLLRLVVVILASGENTIWSDFIMLLGVLQIMLQVPDFIAKAQISHSSSFLTPLSALRGFSSIGAALGEAGQKLWTEGLWRDKDSTDLSKSKSKSRDQGGGSELKTPGSDLGGGSTPTPGPKKKGPSPTDTSATRTAKTGDPGAKATTRASNAGGGQPLATGTAPPTGESPRGKTGKNRFDARNADAEKQSIESAIAELADQENRGQFAVTDGDANSIEHDGTKGATGLTNNQDATAKERAESYLKAALAQKLMRNPGFRRRLAQKLGWAPDPLRSTSMADQEKLFNQAINKMATQGADALVDGRKGNAATALLREMYGDMTPERLEELLSAMQDDGLPNSPFNPNFRRAAENVDGAHLPRNAATLGYAMSPEGSRLKGQALNSAFHALEQATRPSLQAAGYTPGTPEYSEALAKRIKESTPERQKSLTAVGVGFRGAPADEQPQTPEEWEAWANETENTARTLGIKEDQALGRLRAMMGTQAAKNDSRTVPEKLATAAAAIAAANEQKASAQLLNADGPRAGQLYELARTHTDANPTLTPQRIYGVLKAAQVAGFNNPGSAGDDGLIAEMLSPETGDWKAGEIDGGSMALAQRAKAAGFGVKKDACLRVRAAGASADFDPVVFAVAGRSEWDNMLPARAGNGVFAVSSACVGMAQDYLTPAGGNAPAANDPNVVALATRLASSNVAGLTGGDPQIDFINNNPILPEDVLSFQESATLGRSHGIRYSLADVRGGRSLAGQGHFGGRQANATFTFHEAVDACGNAGSGLDVGHIGTAIARMSTVRMPSASFRDAEIIETFAGYSAAEVGDPILMASAAHCVTFAPQGQYRDTVDGVARFVRTGELRDPRSIGQREYEVLTRYEADHGGAPPKAVILQTVGLTGSTPAASLDTITLSAAAHQDFSRLAPDIRAIVGGLAVDFVQTTTGSSDVSIVSHGVQNLPRQDAAVLVAIGEQFVTDQAHAPGGADLVNMTGNVRVIMDRLGFREASKALEFVRRVIPAGGAIDANAVQGVANSVQAMEAIGCAPSDIHSPTMVAAVGALPREMRDPSHGNFADYAPYVAQVVDVFRPEEVRGHGAALVREVREMCTNYGYSVGSVGREDVAGFHIVNAHHAPDVRPVKSFVHHLIEAGIPLNDRERVEVANLPGVNTLRPSEMGQYTEAIRGYLHANGTGIRTICPDVDTLRTNGNFVSTLIAVNRAYGPNACANVDYVEDMYNRNFAPNNDTRVNVSGRGIELIAPP